MPDLARAADKLRRQEYARLAAALTPRPDTGELLPDTAEQLRLRESPALPFPTVPGWFGDGQSGSRKTPVRR